jgi:hypothetical protein
MVTITDIPKFREYMEDTTNGTEIFTRFLTLILFVKKKLNHRINTLEHFNTLCESVNDDIFGSLTLEEYNGVLKQLLVTSSAYVINIDIPSEAKESILCTLVSYAEPSNINMIPKSNERLYTGINNVG